MEFLIHNYVLLLHVAIFILIYVLHIYFAKVNTKKWNDIIELIRDINKKDKL